MSRILASAFFALAVTTVHADVIHLVEYKALEIPITPFSNMASGYQATNPGFRAIIRSESGEFIAGGPMNIDAVIRGYSDDASQGSAYGQLVLRVDLAEVYPGISSGLLSGQYKGVLSICMAKDTEAAIRDTECRSLGGNLHSERPFQWIDKPIEFQVNDGNVKITQYYGKTGDGGTSRQIALAAFHPAFGFAAPGKAFKDYQSPLVLDLNKNGKLDLVNVWDEKNKVHFDLTGVGKKTRTGWVKPSDGILFWDNGSGCAQDGTQFYGEFTNALNGERKYENGFRALAKQLDPSLTGRVKASAHKNLKIWIDRSQDGICKKSEVVSASKYVKEIQLSYETHTDVALNEDNEVRLTGHYLGHDGKQHLIGDVWFKQRRNEVTRK